MAGGEGPSRDIAHVLATASNGNPRMAERIVMTAQGLSTWEPKTVLKAAQITADGLSQDHFDYLKALQRVNRPVGLKHLVDQTMMNGRKLTLRGGQYVSMLEDEGVL
jgi:Holliday junction resolvasome RuvABC ATP-dependent DNA helicase subunit